MAGPLAWDDLEPGGPGLDAGPLEDALPVVDAPGTERLQLLEFLWETDTGTQPVLYLMRQLLD